MSDTNKSKIQLFLDNHKLGTVCLASWFKSMNISYGLQKRYCESGWLESIGNGAFIRLGDEVNWQGGLYALQKQARLSIHVGALSALSLQGMAHYLRMGNEEIFLFSPPKTTLPTWFRNYDWGVKLNHFNSSMLPHDFAFTEYEEKTFTIRISSPERAILECLYLVPNKVDLLECYQIMEGLMTLRPKILQPLLEQCSSVKVKRLFCYMASKADHEWYKRLDISKLDLGIGDRTITKGGVYILEFGLILQQELVNL